jgi:hypothetical protein
MFFSTTVQRCVWVTLELYRNDWKRVCIQAKVWLIVKRKSEFFFLCKVGCLLPVASRVDVKRLWIQDTQKWRDSEWERKRSR